MAELEPFARSLNIATAGPKGVLTERIAARLGNRAAPVEKPRPPSTTQLTGQLSLTTKIPAGQRSTEELRKFFEVHVGPKFRFNGHMRSFLLEGGATLGDAVDHWHETLGTALPKQSESLEFNTFTKLWHAANPSGSAKECRKAWDAHRSLPVDQQPPIG